MKGFTLIEMVVTVALVALLASIVTPMAQMTVQRSKEQELKIALRQIREAIDAYKKAGDEGRVYRSGMTTGYPENLQVLVDGVPDQRDLKGKKIFFLRRLPRDPMATDSRLPAERTWGLRSYASEGAAPQPGDDVYDVYSMKSGAGLNGVPYKEW
ncbi:general secretion pathway protein GspG [Pseudomonas azotoformans]|uniref:General secretion pathway protein GspG n=2 Tax=Pseudomonas azotoformans TaxID=47878 RepID=A0A140GWM4_PSEAZ|nr:type II secretion system protein [Pseudomonas azotoformans]AMN82718.1 general secretion pathway protein GspG [Pseudomonas azotoformans]